MYKGIFFSKLKSRPPPPFGYHAQPLNIEIETLRESKHFSSHLFPNQVSAGGGGIMQECCCGVHAFVCSACAFSLFSLTEMSGVQLCTLHGLQEPQRVKVLRRGRICSSCLLWSFGRNSQRISRAGYHSISGSRMILFFF